MTAIQEEASELPLPPTKQAMIDCDVHNAPRTDDDIKRYLSARWRPYYERGSHVGNRAGVVMGARPHQFFRRDSVPPEGGAPGSDLSLMREQLLDRHNVARAILITLETANFLQYGDIGAAFAAAVNDWNAEQWLAEDDRLFGSIAVPVEDGPRAAREIGRVASNQRFVVVTLPMHTREGLGHPKYWPIYEAADSHRLPVMVHVTALAGVFSAVGIPAYMLEQNTGYWQPFQAQIVSLVYNGVFDRFPGLQFVFAEGGFSWLPSLMWRLDRTWRAMKQEEPHLTTRPSDLIRAHFSFTTQPIDEPNDPLALQQVIGQMNIQDRLLFATDYPHWDFDDPTRTLRESLIGADLRRRIMFDNAERLFPFPAS